MLRCSELLASSGRLLLLLKLAAFPLLSCFRLFCIALLFFSIISIIIPIAFFRRASVGELGQKFIVSFDLAKQFGVLSLHFSDPFVNNSIENGSIYRGFTIY